MSLASAMGHVHEIWLMSLKLMADLLDVISLPQEHNPADCKLAQDSMALTLTSVSFAFVEYESRRDADDAYHEMHNKRIGRDDVLKIEVCALPVFVFIH